MTPFSLAGQTLDRPVRRTPGAGLLRPGKLVLELAVAADGIATTRAPVLVEEGEALVALAAFERIAEVVTPVAAKLVHVARG